MPETRPPVRKNSHRFEVVDRKPVLAIQAAESTAQRVAADAGVRHDAGRRYEAVFE